MGLLRMAQLSWARARALSVLQNAYEMPLKYPLEALDDQTLRLVTEAAYDTGGNAFDAAAGFMTFRIKCALEAELRAGCPVMYDPRPDMPKLSVGIARTASFMKFYRGHMDTLGEINKLKAEVDARSTKAT